MSERSVQEKNMTPEQVDKARKEQERIDAQREAESKDQKIQEN